MNIYFGCDPDRVRELGAAVEAALGSIARGDIDPQRLDRSIEILRQGFTVSLQDNSYLARSYANFFSIFEEPLSGLMARPAQYGAVRAQDIQGIAALLLPQGSIRVILYPEQ
jgi:zinc protease